MIEEYKLNYEVALARKAKLHCHPAEAVKFAYDNGPFNHTALANAMESIELNYDVTHESWNNKRSTSKAERKARTAMVTWLMRQGFPVIAVARILDISVPSVNWSRKQPPPFFLPGYYMGVLENA
jgi:hypothetical protein